jgi:hypothetical protein
VSKVIAASIYSVICFIMWHYITIYSGIISIFEFLHSLACKPAGEPLTGAYANRLFRTRWHGVTEDCGTPARSVCASMANGVGIETRWQACMLINEGEEEKVAARCVCQPPLPYLRQRPKSALGMLARSAYASMANGGVEKILSEDNY